MSFFFVRVRFAVCQSVLYFCFSSGEEEGEVIHMGNAIMSFYSALIDLLGRCAPEMHVRIFFVMHKLTCVAILTLNTVTETTVGTWMKYKAEYSPFVSLTAYQCR